MAKDKDGGKKNKDSAKLGKSEYLDRLGPLQLQLTAMARWLQSKGQRIVVVVEGRDTAGKGGVIASISETLNPRQCHTVALGKPSEQDRGAWYFQRYVAHLPSAGEIALFDRSWYNRAGVEAVMGFCTPEQTAHFLSQPFHVAEVFTGSPGKYVPLKETIRGFKMIVAGECDALPEQAFYMVGTIDEAMEKAKKLG